VNKNRIIVAGHICLDITPKFLSKEGTLLEEIMIPGKLVNMGEINVSTGGPVSNTGIALSKLGNEVLLMGKTGDDFFGNGISQLLEKAGVDCKMSVSTDDETSYTVVIVPKGIDRIFLHNPGANNTFSSEDIDYDVAANASLFHFGYPPLMKTIYKNKGEELVKIFKKVKKLGLTTSLDMSLPDLNSESAHVDWEGILTELLPYVDLYLPSIEETSFMLDRSLFHSLQENKTGTDLLETLDISVLPSLGDKLLSLGAKIAVIKCGEKGFYIRTAGEEKLSKIGTAKPRNLDNWINRELHEESFHVPHIASATGSGDSSIAGFLTAYAKGLSIEECIRSACAVGGENVTCVDALSGILSWDETQALLDKGWEKNILKPKGDLWSYDEERCVWVGPHDKFLKVMI
jgi:sugar/nucleoside kinase (ribokinase family)